MTRDIVQIMVFQCCVKAIYVKILRRCIFLCFLETAQIVHGMMSKVNALDFMLKSFTDHERYKKIVKCFFSYQMYYDNMTIF